ncbi:hypothetical protein NBO_118g0003 [Nosema bombycis CQ1]|uniref:Uncharacterized protein n=1 Tax=Nosema bombycis (strain CQ1 / CVCC 102059) TaxID=578461 RepID=R0MK81_NOSB1|nr:hypothetical protein NBO_118g0003 [Nosema bombycis CQ1]|eukprot:EOB13203.1 hypothetical protein NBO_118g0003 [Nosema bombycis CQ1]
MVKTGFSDVIGSWKIIAISAPRTPRISVSDCSLSSITCRLRRRSSSASLRTSLTAWSSRRISARDVTDFPEPDSPTIASVSPRRRVNDRSRTAEKACCC